MLSLFFLAPPPQGGEQGDPLAQMLPTMIMLVAIVFIFYFMMIRPQKKRQEAHRKLLDSLRRGDKVVTASGIHGTVADVEESTVMLQVSDNTKIRVDRSSVASITTQN